MNKRFFKDCTAEEIEQYELTDEYKLAHKVGVIAWQHWQWNLIDSVTCPYRKDTLQAWAWRRGVAYARKI